MPNYSVLLLLLATPVFAQTFAFGVKGGVPLTDAFSTASGDPVSFSSVTRRYTLGPTAEIGLPYLGLRLEVDALYHRTGWDSARIATPLLDAYQSTARFGAWDFDALLKRRVGRARAHPYVGAGAAFRRFFATRETYTFPGDPARDLSLQYTAEVRHKNVAGIVFSAGFELGGALRIGPEFRYTRWLANNIHDNFPNLATQLNQAEILVSFTFGRH